MAAPLSSRSDLVRNRRVSWICNGSVEEVLVGMVDSNMIDRKQLRMLLDRMDERKTGRR
jgi:BlaI family transcriptional regulator, penicillinase repressor